MDQGYSLSNTWEYLQHWQVALHDTVTALILAIIIIVVAVPEGLPMMIAIVLALNMQKLLDQNVCQLKLSSNSLRYLYAACWASKPLEVSTFFSLIRLEPSHEDTSRHMNLLHPKGNPMNLFAACQKH